MEDEILRNRYYLVDFMGPLESHVVQLKLPIQFPYGKLRWGRSSPEATVETAATFSRMFSLKQKLPGSIL